MDYLLICKNLKTGEIASFSQTSNFIYTRNAIKTMGHLQNKRERKSIFDN